MRQPPQYTLARLMALMGLLALPLSLAHYYLHGPEWFKRPFSALLIFGATALAACVFAWVLSVWPAYLRALLILVGLLALIGALAICLG
jgi:hypothetical protein